MKPIAPGWALGADDRQWILYQVGRKPYPVHFIATHKRIIERLVREEGIALTREGRDVIDALPDHFGSQPMRRTSVG